jgi:predicted metalloprotease with PDZ domain
MSSWNCRCSEDFKDRYFPAAPSIFINSRQSAARQLPHKRKIADSVRQEELPAGEVLSMRLTSILVVVPIFCCAIPSTPAKASAVGAKGPIQIQVDATDTVHKVFSVIEIIPVQGEDSITLLYPRWEIGSHAPTISVADLAGLKLQINGRPLEWRRDPLDVNAFHVALPRNATTLEAHFQYLSPVSAGVMSRNIVQVQWEHMMLYPQGLKVDDIPVVAQLRLPAGFQAASSLRVMKAADNTIDYQLCSLSELADAPVVAGRFMSSWLLSADGALPVRLDVVADEENDLTISTEQVEALRKTVKLTNEMFGSVPFRHYDFLVSATDRLPNDGGSEHQESSEISLPADYFLNPEKYTSMAASLFPHEYIHAWNGISHRPAGMVAPDFNTPMQDAMLWVYEGLTELLSLQIARESGLISDRDYRGLIAIDAAEQSFRPGRQWKSLADSDNDPIYLAGRRITWRDWERREDYYTEGPLLWLGVDAQIRRVTDGKRTLRDFAHSFFAAGPKPLAVEPYTFSSLIATLNTVAPFSWQGYLLTRLNAHDGAYIQDDLKSAGYSLIFGATETRVFAQEEQADGVIDLSYSIGARVLQNGVLQSVSWDGPAFKAGMVPGMKITAVDGKAFSLDILRQRIQGASPAQIRLSVLNEAGEVEELDIDDHAGLRFPDLSSLN